MHLGVIRIGVCDNNLEARNDDVEVRNENLQVEVTRLKEQLCMHAIDSAK